jgi:hypothetical protein
MLQGSRSSSAVGRDEPDRDGGSEDSDESDSNQRDQLLGCRPRRTAGVGERHRQARVEESTVAGRRRKSSGKFFICFTVVIYTLKS